MYRNTELKDGHLSIKAGGRRGPELGHAPAGRHSTVDLQATGDYHVRERYPGPATSLGRFDNGVAQVPQQNLKLFLFIGLGQVVDRPGGRSGRRGNGVQPNADTGGPISLPPQGVGRGKDMLAGFLPLLEVRAGAEGLLIENHHVGPVVGLGRDLESHPVALDGHQGRDGQPALLASFLSVVRVIGAQGCNLVGFCSATILKLPPSQIFRLSIDLNLLLVCQPR